MNRTASAAAALVVVSIAGCGGPVGPDEASDATGVTGPLKTTTLAWSPASYDYGTLDAAQGDTASHAFTVTNTDGKPTAALTIGLSGSAAFSITSDACTGTKLPPRKSCSVTVQYAPSTNGTYSATLTATTSNAAAATSSVTGASAWSTGSFTTYSQVDSGWGDISAAGGTLLANNFGSLYSNGGITIGGNYIAVFDDANSVFAYLPQGGAPGALTFSMSNPTDSSAGSLGSDVLALKLNVDFSDAGLLLQASSTALGDLHICGFVGVTNITVRDFLAEANILLGGGSVSGLTTSGADATAEHFNNAFLGGTPSTWAQDHLFPGSCPP